MRVSVRLWVGGAAICAALAGCGAPGAAPTAAWAIPLMIVAVVVAALAVRYILGAVGVLLFALLIGLGDLEQKLTPRRSRIAPAVVVMSAFLVSSFAGAGLAGVGMSAVWRHTGFQPWLVQAMFGLTTLAMLHRGREAGRQDESGGWGWVIVSFLTAGCLFGYVWAAAFDGSLVGPWRWCSGLAAG